MPGDIVAFCVKNKDAIVYQLDTAPDQFGRMKFTRWWWGERLQENEGVCAENFNADPIGQMRTDVFKNRRVFKTGHGCHGIQEVAF